MIRQLALACGFAVVLTACGGGGGGGSPAAPVAVVPAPKVAVALAAPKTPVGGTNTLTWTSTNATSCAISGAMTAAGLGANSSQTLSPTVGGQFKYTVTCTGAGGSAVADATMITPIPVQRTSYLNFKNNGQGQTTLPEYTHAMA